MVGSGALIECLEDARVASVTVVVRRQLPLSHAKLRQVEHADFYAYDSLRELFAQADCCFFCLGVSAVGLGEPAYRRQTFDLTLAAARAMVAANPMMTFCYVSGAGTDSTEKGRVMWARVKGATENALLALPFRAAYMFRPAFILRLKGVRTKTRLYAAVYAVMVPLYPVLRRIAPRFVTTSVQVGRALINVAGTGYSSRILDSLDIEQAARPT